MRWEREILQKLEKAAIVILLISNDFIRSYYCMVKEMDHALERHGKGLCVIVPIVVRACAYDKLSIGDISAFCRAANP